MPIINGNLQELLAVTGLPAVAKWTPEAFERRSKWLATFSGFLCLLMMALGPFAVVFLFMIRSIMVRTFAGFRWSFWRYKLEYATFPKQAA